MKLKFIYTCFILALTFFLFTASKNGRAGSAGWGNTGAPGDEVFGNQPRVCQSCHNSVAIQVSQTFEITDDNGNDVFIDGYTPGKTYNVKLTVNAAVGSPQAHGFQILCLNAPLDQEGPEASNWATTAANVKINTASNTGRTYVEHPSPSDSNEFLMTWTAPTAGSGEVTFYVVSNGVNNNNSNTGDGATSGKFTLAEGESVYTKDVELEVEMTLFPNPVESQMNVAISTEEGGLYNWSVIDVLGRTLQSGQFDLPHGKSQQSISLTDMVSGLYHFELTKGAKWSSRYLVKK